MAARCRSVMLVSKTCRSSRLASPSLACTASSSASLRPPSVSKAGKNRRLVSGHHTTSLGYHQRIGNRFRNVGKQRRHRVSRLKIMFIRKTWAINFSQFAPGADTNQCIVWLAHRCRLNLQSFVATKGKSSRSAISSKCGSAICSGFMPWRCNSM